MITRLYPDNDPRFVLTHVIQNTNVEPAQLCCRRKLILPPIQKAKLTLLDHAPKERVSVFTKRFVLHITRRFILSVRVTGV